MSEILLLQKIKWACHAFLHAEHCILLIIQTKFLIVLSVHVYKQNTDTNVSTSIYVYMYMYIQTRPKSHLYTPYWRFRS